jgi:hypothetical protein
MACFKVLIQHLPEEIEKLQTVSLRIVSFQTENHIKGSQILCRHARPSTVTFSGVVLQARTLTCSLFPRYSADG